MAVTVYSAAGGCFSTRKRASISGRPFLSRALPAGPCPASHKKPLRCRTRRHRGGAASFLPPLVARTRALPTPASVHCLLKSVAACPAWPLARLSGPPSERPCDLPRACRRGVQQHGTLASLAQSTRRPTSASILLRMAGQA